MFAIFETSSCLLVLLTNGKLLFCTVRKVISPTLGTSGVVGGSDYTFQPIVVRNSMRCCRKSARDRRRFAVKTRAHTTKPTLPIGLHFPGGEFSHHRMTSPRERRISFSKVNTRRRKSRLIRCYCESNMNSSSSWLFCFRCFHYLETFIISNLTSTWILRL